MSRRENWGNWRESWKWGLGTKGKGFRVLEKERSCILERQRKVWNDDNLLFDLYFLRILSNGAFWVGNYQLVTFSLRD